MTSTAERERNAASLREVQCGLCGHADFLDSNRYHDPRPTTHRKVWDVHIVWKSGNATDARICTTCVLKLRKDGDQVTQR